MENSRGACVCTDVLGGAWKDAGSLLPRETRMLPPKSRRARSRVNIGIPFSKPPGLSHQEHRYSPRNRVSERLGQSAHAPSPVQRRHQQDEGLLGVIAKHLARPNYYLYLENFPLPKGQTFPPENRGNIAGSVRRWQIEARLKSRSCCSLSHSICLNTTLPALNRKTNICRLKVSFYCKYS